MKCSSSPMCYSYDGVHSPDPLAICAASAALVISDIPLVKPIGAVRVGLDRRQIHHQPHRRRAKTLPPRLDLAGTEDAILMIEGYADFLTEEQILEAVEEGHQAIRKICQALSDWQKEIGKPKNIERLRLIPHEAHRKKSMNLAAERYRKGLRIKEKQVREETIKAISESSMPNYFPEERNNPKYKKNRCQSRL